LGLLSANITIYNVVTGIISEPQKLPDIVEFMLFTSALEPDLHHCFDIVEFTFFTSGSALEPETFFTILAYTSVDVASDRSASLSVDLTGLFLAFLFFLLTTTYKRKKYVI
jgi:hypothetical protein